MTYFLGIDGGGTKTAAVLLNSDQQLVGSGIGGPCNIAALEPETAFEKERMRNGIPLLESVVNDLKGVGEKFGVEL